MRKKSLRSMDFCVTAKGLTSEALQGNIHLDICEGISKMDPQIGNYAPTFFTHSFYAHLYAAQMYAAKLFDSHRKSLTVPVFLQLSFERRNDFKHATAGDVVDCIGKAKTVIRGLGATITVLEERRNNFLAHISPVLVFERKKLEQGPPLTFAQIRKVLIEAGRIVNRLLFMWCEETFPVLDHRTDDFKAVVKMMCKQICADADASEAEAAKYGYTRKIPRPKSCE